MIALSALIDSINYSTKALIAHQGKLGQGYPAKRWTLIKTTIASRLKEKTPPETIVMQRELYRFLSYITLILTIALIWQ